MSSQDFVQFEFSNEDGSVGQVLIRNSAIVAVMTVMNKPELATLFFGGSKLTVNHSTESVSRVVAPAQTVVGFQKPKPVPATVTEYNF